MSGVSDIAARRRAILGQPAAAKDAEPSMSLAHMQELSRLLDALDAATNERDALKTQLLVAQADLVEALKAREPAPVQADVAAGYERQIADQREARGRAEAERDAAIEAKQVAEQALARECEMRTAAEAKATPAVVSQPIEFPAPPALPKAWLLETRDSAGNPRKVRMTPEY